MTYSIAPRIQIIQTLAVPSSEAADQQADGMMPLSNGVVSISADHRIVSYVHGDFMNAPHVGNGLKQFVSIIMAVRTEHMWTLARLLQYAIDRTRWAPEESFYGGVVPPTETNEAIFQFVQDYMFNASTNPPPFGTTDGADGTSSSEPGPLSRIFESTFGGLFGTGRNRGPNDVDLSLPIPDLREQPLPPGFVPPDPYHEARAAYLPIMRANMLWTAQNRRRHEARPTWIPRVDHNMFYW
ncbi:hypothetical protein PG997_013085 [Apiospora hydei]|uniref:Uncharacterized protein n=1 Tax=Apiospora hydei TaxID=1337664 RepID=A0ABR1V582_9PEZI